MTTVLPPLAAPVTTDRVCDRCGHGAKILAVLPNGHDLLFCQHHADEYGPKLLAIDAITTRVAPTDPESEF